MPPRTRLLRSMHVGMFACLFVYVCWREAFVTWQEAYVCWHDAYSII